ncbi:unnamed protein product [Orchesella dallaii]|uniref:Uncharacterized protein n=1 Tax=Orchesella dallaii TaxID=48710 RepID=A0ABP1PXJ7_9HEXA
MHQRATLSSAIPAYEELEGAVSRGDITVEGGPLAESGVTVSVISHATATTYGKFVLDGFGQIKSIHQAELEISAIYSKYVIPNRTIRKPKVLEKKKCNRKNFSRNVKRKRNMSNPYPDHLHSGTPLDGKRPLQLLDASLRLSTGKKRVSPVGRRWDLEDELEGIKPGKFVFDEDFSGFAR